MATAKSRGRLRRLCRALVGVALCYLGVIVVLLFLENRLLFHPSGADDWDPPPDNRTQDVWLEAGALALHAWWYVPPEWEPARGAMLYCHGNAGNLSHRGGAIAAWAQRRREAVLIFDYPGYGRSQGKPREAGCYAAAGAAYDWLVTQQHVPPERIILFGRSLGGAVATHLACSRPHRALVLVSPFTSVPDMAQHLYPWLPGRWLVRNRFDSRARIADCHKPVFIAHGTADSLVPLTQGEQLHAAANEPKCFFAMEGAGHNSPIPVAVYRRLDEFLAAAEQARSI